MCDKSYKNPEQKHTCLFGLIADRGGYFTETDQLE